MSEIENLSSAIKVLSLNLAKQHQKSNDSSSSEAAHRTCDHWFIQHKICFICKSKVPNRDDKSFEYLFLGLRISREAIPYTKRFNTLISLHRDKKLHLILDLDHTLIHSVKASEFSKDEKYLIREKRCESNQDLWKFEDGYIKLRPFVKEFLKEANEIFNMYVYTMGARDYAQAVVKLIDPERKYFGNRVISRETSPKFKTLDLVLADERSVVILDDTLEVWPNHQRNLLLINKYFYFRDGNQNEEMKSLAESKRDESRSRGTMASVLRYLKELHTEFFRFQVREELDSKDVRLLLKGPRIPRRTQSPQA